MLKKDTFKLKFQKLVFVDVEEEININEYLAKRITTIMREKKLKKNDVALKCGFINSTYLNRYEKGTGITIINLQRLCKGLDCKSSDLLPF
jgi:DNA-binding Xre family transcriptional regulator